ncbi:MAG: YitT family protein [Chitinophagales bacterium]|nr:YitT family protein [Chitinophagales bacterium]
MNPLLTKVIVDRVLRGKHSTSPHSIERYSAYRLAKGLYELRVTILRALKDAALILAGMFSASIGLKSFLLPNKFIDGGAMGVSLLLAELTPLGLAPLIVLVNAPFILMGYKIISRQFAFKTVLAIVGLAILVAVLPLPSITSDKLLISIFGGIFLGAGIGLSVRGGAVIDGTEVLAIFMSRKLGVTMGDVILFINLMIFSFVGYVFSIETALYSVLTYMAASKTVDFIIEGIEEYTAVTIVSVHHAEVLQMFKEVMGRGATVFKGKMGVGKREDTREVDIVYSVVTRLEVSKLNAEIEKIDPNAFVVFSRVKDTKGGMVKSRPIPH